MARLDDAVAIVVGAGQTPGETIGNGRAIATTFAREGALVLCVDRIEARAHETVDAIRAAGGVADAIVADITDGAQCDALAQATLDRWGRIDVLVNNAGIGGGGDGPAHSADDDAFDRILDVNLRAMWRTCRAVLPVMREQQSGSIVNISSAASVAGGFQVAYEVSKAAVNRLTTSIAQSNASRGVRCNAVALGLVDTPMAVGGIARPGACRSMSFGRNAMPASRCAAAWARRGMPPTRRSSSHRRKPASSPVRSCPSTAAPRSASADRAARRVFRDLRDRCDERGGRRSWGQR